MPSNFEWELLTRIVKDGSLKEALDWGLRSEDFGITQARGMFDIMLSMYMNQETAGSIPGAHTIAHIYPGFQLVGDDSVTTPFLCQQVRAGFQLRETKALATRTIELIDKDLGGALNALTERSRQLLELGTVRKTDTAMGEGATTSLTNYQGRKSGLITRPLSWPWPGIQRDTRGIDAQDYIVFYGRPKQFKSWVLAYLAAHALEQGLRVMMYTKEMTPESMRERIITCALNLDYKKFMHATLSPSEEEKLAEYCEHWAGPLALGELIMLDATRLEGGNDNIGWLEAKAEKHQAEIVFIDGLHLMSDMGKTRQADHERVRSISHQVRHLGMRKRIPILVTLQANRKAAGHGDGNLDEIAFSDAIGQDATIIFRTIAERHQPTIALIMAASRQGQLNSFRLHRKVAENMTEHSVLDEAEVMELSQREADGKLPKKTVAKPRTPTNGASARATSDEALPVDVENLVEKHWQSVRVRH